MYEFGMNHPFVLVGLAVLVGGLVLCPTVILWSAFMGDTDLPDGSVGWFKWMTAFGGLVGGIAVLVVGFNHVSAGKTDEVASQYGVTVRGQLGTDETSARVVTVNDKKRTCYLADEAIYCLSDSGDFAELSK